MVTSILLFPGQGAQKVGMGKDLAEWFPAARLCFKEIDDALGVTLSKLMWEGPEAELTLTHNAQPAILTHSLAVHAALRDAGLSPAAAAGHSLGEYSAYVAAGALSAAAAAKLVRRRGELMLAAGSERKGTMSAVIGLDTAAVESACREASDDRWVAVAANENAPDQTVISGDPPAVARAGEACKKAGARRVLPLNVSGAFHSPLMAPAREGLEVELKTVDFADPSFPVIANARAIPVTDAATAKTLLGEQLTAPVRWVDCVLAAVKTAGLNPTFLELGPGRVLSGLSKRIVPNATCTAIGSAEEVSAFLESLA